MMLVWVYLLLVFVGEQAQAYPIFIGYGYRNCMGCHESGSGGGALTDYGRGVFAAEIAANPFRNWISDDAAAERSGFLGSVKSPYWLRAGVKYRSLAIENSPGSSQKSVKHYNMQNDLNLNFFGNRDHTQGLITTIGYIENTDSLSPNIATTRTGHLFFREYFLKAQFDDRVWLNIGFMDKVFGIRTENHTAVNRSPLGLGQNDQVHAGLIHIATENSDHFVQVWMGNAHLPDAKRLSGGSFSFDRKWGESHSWGLSFLVEGRNQQKRNLVAVHNKMGFGSGDSMLLESGFRNETLPGENVSNYFTTNGYYLFSQGSIYTMRGLFVLSGLELSRTQNGDESPIQMAWNLGLLYFPIQRFEFRFSGVNQKKLNATQPERDRWLLQSQMHLSF